jgi:signal transduction histidine kinase
MVFSDIVAYAFPVMATGDEDNKALARCNIGPTARACLADSFLKLARLCYASFQRDFILALNQKGKAMSDPQSPPEVEELKLTLQRSPLLRALMEVAPDSMMSALRDEFFKSGTVLFREGDAGDRVYAIWSGKLRVQHEIGAGQVLVMRDCVPGDVVGEVSLLDNRPRSATVVVLEDARLVSLSNQDFGQLVAQRPNVVLSLLQALGYRLRSSDDYLLAASRSVDYLMQRMGDRAVEGSGDTSTVAYTMQWESLHRLFEDIGDAANGIGKGLVNLRQYVIALDDEFDTSALDLMTGHADNIIRKMDELRRLNELQSSELALNIRSIMLGALADKIASRFAPVAHIQGVQFYVSVAPGIPHAKIDEALIDEAISELVENALHYSPQHTTVRIEVGHYLGREFQVAVIDQGPGVPPDYREVIFEPFVQGPGDWNQGMGLGLARCQAIVRAHGGRIWAEAGTSGKGAAFRFTLPGGAK